MVPVKSKNISPVKKWQTLISYPKWSRSNNFRFFYKVKTLRKKTLSGRINIRGLKFFKKTYLFDILKIKPTLRSLVVFNFGYRKFPLKEFVVCKTIYGEQKILPSNDYIKPGFVFYNLSTLLKGDTNLFGQYIPISILPINTIISSVFNKYNQYMTYALSSGCIAKKRKNFKKSKLTYVELPSTKRILLSTETFCLFGPTQNLYMNRVVTGGYGVLLNVKKKISVRGVAMNPVDHPNGGRTKAKQPELSPWGWIAKRCK